MSIGKSQKSGKGGRRGKKAAKDAFLRKDWYDVMAPAIFAQRATGKTPVNKTAGTKLSIDSLRGRVFDVCLADLQGEEEQAHRRIRLRALDTNGTELLTQFHGMRLTTDKLRSLVRKWHSTIEANVQVKTSDDYTLRVFVIGFTRRRPNSTKKSCYAQASQIRQIRKKMVEVVRKQIEGAKLADAVNKINGDTIGKLIEKDTKFIYPLQNVVVRKVKVIKAPRLDTAAVKALHEVTAATLAASAAKPAAEDKGEPVEKPVEAAA